MFSDSHEFLNDCFSTGTHAKIKYTVKTYDSLEPPYGTCTIQESDESDEFGLYCLYKCISQDPRQLCGCTSYVYGMNVLHT